MVIALVLNILLFAASVCLSVYDRYSLPSSSLGLFDLRGWDWQNRGTVQLQGDWQFAGGRFAAPEDVDSFGSAAVPVRIPGRWGAYTKERGWEDQFGFGTYRLRVLLGEQPPPIMAIRVTEVFSAHTLYVNGKPVGGSGSPGVDREHYVPDNRPYIAYVDTDGGTLDIVMHVSNFVHTNKGGMFGPVTLGLPEDVNRIRIVQLVAQFCMMLVLLLFALIFFLIGVYRRRRTEGWTYFVCYCVCTVIYISLRQEKWLLLLFPSISFGTAVRLTFVFSVLGVLFFHLFSSVRHRPFGWVAFNRALGGLLLAYAVFCLLADTEHVSYTTIVWLCGIMIVSLYSLVLLLRIALYGEREAVYDFAMALTLAGVGFTRLGAEFGLQTSKLYVLQISAFVFSMAVMLVQKYFRSYRRAEDMSLQLRKTDRHKEEFIAHTAVELSKPIQALTSVVQSVLEDGGPDKHERELMLVVSVGRRLTALLNDLVDWSMLKEGRGHMNQRPVDLRQTASGVLEVLRYLEPGLYEGLSNGIAAGLPKAVADELRLNQIFTNLLQHVVKHTPAGDIRLTATTVGARIKVRLSGTERSLTNGKLDSICQTYERFYPQPDFWTEDGLWLALSAKLVELHGGKLRVEAEGGGGAFVFDLPAGESGFDVLPAADGRKDGGPHNGLPKGRSAWPQPLSAWEAGRADAEEKEDEEAGRERGNVLIVDDDAMNLIAMRNLLRLEGISPKVARYAEEAQAELRQPWKWDLIIVDLRMPGLSGIELCRSIRERFPLFELPVLMMTSAGRPQDAIAAFAAGANDCLAKPVDLPELRARVRTLLRMKRSATERIRMETAFLQAQIKPHFLFNTLNSIAALADDEPARMKRLLSHFGTYLRESIRFDNAETVVALERELQLVKSYLDIERERFGSRLRVSWEVPDGLLAFIPPLLIQPIVENAVRHGVMKRKEGGRIDIRIGREGDDFVIRVADDGVGIPSHWRENRKSGTGVGLENVERRIKQTYGTDLMVTGDPQTGTIVEVRLPWKEVSVS